MWIKFPETVEYDMLAEGSASSHAFSRAAEEQPPHTVYKINVINPYLKHSQVKEVMPKKHTVRVFLYHFYFNDCTEFDVLQRIN